MNIKTKFVGDINIEENDIIQFDNGIPGFDDFREYVIIPVEESPAIYYLQSIQESRVCFIVMSPFVIKEDYDIEISQETVNRLKIESIEDVCIYAIVNIQDDIKNATVNLKAPIIINTKTKMAAQELLETDKYLIKHKLVKED